MVVTEEQRVCNEGVRYIHSANSLLWELLGSFYRTNTSNIPFRILPLCATSVLFRDVSDIDRQTSIIGISVWTLVVFALSHGVDRTVWGTFQL